MIDLLLAAFFSPPQITIDRPAIEQVIMRKRKWGKGGGISVSDSPPVDPPPPPDPQPGATLPNTRTLVDIDATYGTLRYISPIGTDTGACTSAGSPCLLLSYAYTQSVAGDAIIFRDGTYSSVARQTINKANLGLIAYPDETPIIDGSTAAITGWTVEGSLKYRSYTAQPITDARSVGLPTCGNQTATSPNCVGRYSDQFYVGSTESKQRYSKNDIDATGEFWVDQTITLPGTGTATNNSTTLTGSGTNFLQFKTGDSITVGGQTKTINTIPSNTSLTVTVAFSPAISGQAITRNGNSRLYVWGTEDVTAAKVCGTPDGFLTVNVAGVRVEGLTVTRYCNEPDDFGIIVVNAGGDQFHAKNNVFSHSSFEWFTPNGTSTDQLEDFTLEFSTIEDTNWSGILGTYQDDQYIHKNIFEDMDPNDEFTNSPVSGAVKTTRSIRNIFDYNVMSRVSMHCLWLDQSNWDNNIIAGNVISNCSGNGVFFEISQELYLLDNYIHSNGNDALKFAGSSELIAWNNTFVGGPDVVGIYTDSRTKSWCSNYLLTPTFCLSGADSDRDKARAIPAELDWFPRISTWKNNIAAYPSGSGGLCSVNTVVCITRLNSCTQTTQTGNVATTASSTTVNGSTTGLTASNPITVNDTGEVLFAATITNSTSFVARTAAKKTEASSTFSKCLPASGVGPGATSLWTIMHAADVPYAGLPATAMDRNVYAATSEPIFRVGVPTSSSLVSYTTAVAFEAAMDDANPYPALDGLELNSIVGTQYVGSDGVPTAALESFSGTAEGGGGCTGHACAAAIPVDAVINSYIAAGTKHLGTTIN